MDDLIIIENKIYEIRGQKVMLDFDLAEMYEIETKNLNIFMPSFRATVLGVMPT